MHRSCAPSSTPTTPSPRKSATPPTARTSAIAWSPARAPFSLSPTPASPTTSRPCSSPTIRAQKKSTTARCTMPGQRKTNFSIAACSQRSRSISSPTPNPSASTNPARSSISSTNGPCAPASTPRKKSTNLPWTNSPSSAKSIPNLLATSAPRATSALASPPPSALKAPTSAASKSGSTSPTSPAASKHFLWHRICHLSCNRLLSICVYTSNTPLREPCSVPQGVSAYEVLQYENSFCNSSSCFRHNFLRAKCSNGNGRRSRLRFREHQVRRENGPLETPLCQTRTRKSSRLFPPG